MTRHAQKAKFAVRDFLRRQDGVATVDWVIICAGATGAALVLLNLGQDGLSQYSGDVRDEVQSPYFDTSWTVNVPIPPQDTWGSGTPITPNYEDISLGGDLGGHFDPPTTDNRPEDQEEDPDGGEGTDDPPPNGGQQNGGNSGQGGGGTAPQTSQSNFNVLNASFEQTNHGEGAWSAGVPGWTISKGGSGDVGDFNPNFNAINGATVTGNNVAYLFHNGGSTSFAAMSQSFNTTYQAGATYAFSADIGDGAYAFSGNLPYVMNIYAGNTIIGTRSGTTGDINALQTQTVTSTVNDASLNGQQIRFEIVHPPGGGGDLLVDNVRGTITTPLGSGPQVTTTPIAGCPSPNYIAPPTTTTGQALANQTNISSHTAGGATNVANCAGIPGRGFFNANPSITLNLSGMTADSDFEDFEVELSSNCDTTLLIRDAQGNWHFDDDSGPGLNSRLRLRNLAALNGQVSIWVGTFGSAACSNVEVRIRVRD